MDGGPGAALPRRCLFLDGGRICERGGTIPNTAGQNRLHFEAAGDCLREDWDPTMYDEDGHPVERLVTASGHQQETKDPDEEKISPICYLHIPAGKNRGAFWIWLPGYVAEAIKVWKRERPPSQGKLL